MKIVDTGSITRAADVLHIAQPALSQQVSALEAEFKQQLLIRSKYGIEPTAAGRALYRQAQVILAQVGQAHAAVDVAGRTPAGRVSVGIAPYSTGAAIALPLLRTVRKHYPDIVLHLNENFGGILSEAIMTGRMDLAFLYGAGPIRGVRFEPILSEDLFLVQAGGAEPSATSPTEVSVADLKGVGLLLPSPIHTIRQVVDSAFHNCSLELNVVGEVESVLTLGRAISEGLGATILPWSAAQAILDVEALTLRRIVDPPINLNLSLCSSDLQPLSGPAAIVYDMLEDLIRKFAETSPTANAIGPKGV